MATLLEKSKTEAPIPKLENWYCGLSFIHRRRFDELLRKHPERYPGMHFFLGGWIAFREKIYERMSGDHYNNKIKMHGTEYVDKEFFDLDICYHYTPDSGNELTWPDYASLAVDGREDKTPGLKIADVLFETMRVHGMVPHLLRKKFLGIGRVKYAGRAMERKNVYQCSLAFTMSHNKDSILSREKSPTVSSLYQLLKTVDFDTTVGSIDNKGNRRTDPRGELLQDCIEEQILSAMSLKIDIDRTLKNQFVLLKERDTICTVLDQIVKNLDAVWEWKGANEIAIFPSD